MAETEKASIKKQESVSEDYDREVKHIDNTSANVKLANPLAGIPHDQLMEDAAIFARDHGLGHLEEEFKKGDVKELGVFDEVRVRILPVLGACLFAVLSRGCVPMV